MVKVIPTSVYPARRVRPVAMLMFALAGMGLFAGVVCAADIAKTASADDLKFFEEQVRPLLQANCIKCHGGEAKIKGSFRLTSRESILKGGDDGKVISLETPEKSLLLSAVNYTGEMKMPPRGKLAPEQIEILTRWVNSGLAWPAGLDLAPTALAQAAPTRPDPPTPREARKNFWSFQPVKRPSVPQVKDAAWVRNPVDAFVLAKLEEKGLRPAPPAEKVALLRRATYDLTGLPPTPADVDLFVADNSPDAYEKLIDRLLDSPHYGEKWGRHYLDLIRYGESNSYERDNAKPNVWRFRDYVIQSFNKDKPYDQFVKEQLAGDEMPQTGEITNYEPIIATAFYRLGIWDDEPSDRLQQRYDNLDDIVVTTGQVFMGLTIDCARCHNHKIDPILQTDYYRLLAFFQNINGFHNGGRGDEVEIFDKPGGRQAYEAFIAAKKKRANEIQAICTTIENEFRVRYSTGGKPAVRSQDIDDLHYRYYRDSWNKLPDFENLKAESEGIIPSGLIDIGLRTRETAFGFVFTGTLIVPQDGKYTFYLDSDDGSRLTINGKMAIEYDGIHGTGQERRVVLGLEKGRIPIKLEYFQNQNGLGLDAAWSGPGFERRSLSGSTTPSFTPGKRYNPKLDVGRLIFELGNEVLGKERFAEYDRLRRELDQVNKPPVHERVLCVSEPGAGSPDTYICLRGNANVQGDKVQPGFPAVLADGDAIIPKPPAGASSSGRRTVLADWITSEQNPLFSRVMANRIFQYHFGRGIVRSPNNFGVQGDRPTHPELLDWLASEFRDSGFRFKPMHRLLMTSNAYRMSCKVDSTALAADPRNDSLWRFDLRRLTAEEVRDSILAVDGTLNQKMYGPSIYPYIPAELKAGQTHPGEGWMQSKPEEAARRSVYVHVKRSLPVPILQAFDAAETDRSCPVRFVTVQPTQALGMLNGSFLNEEAAKFAQRVQKEAGDDKAKQVALAFRLATSRTPSDQEVARGLNLIDALQKQDKASPEQAMKYFCLMVLNLNEFIYVD